MKIVILYSSLTGNTESMAENVAEGVKAAGAEPVLKEVFNTQASELLHYDGFILGAYTWGDGELPDDFFDFYDDMDELDLVGRKAAVFGSGETAYTHFCGAVDILIDKLKERGADVIAPGLKIELNPGTDEKEACRELGKQVVLTVTVS